MIKPVEERVKTLIEQNDTLSIREKSEIICLIECYKGADTLLQRYFKNINESMSRLEKLRTFIRNESDYITGSTEIIAELTLAINKLKEGVE